MADNQAQSSISTSTAAWTNHSLVPLPRDGRIHQSKAARPHGSPYWPSYEQATGVATRRSWGNHCAPSIGGLRCGVSIYQPSVAYTSRAGHEVQHLQTPLNPPWPPQSPQ